MHQNSLTYVANFSHKVVVTTLSEVCDPSDTKTHIPLAQIDTLRQNPLRFFVTKIKNS